MLVWNMTTKSNTWYYSPRKQEYFMFEYATLRNGYVNCTYILKSGVETDRIAISLIDEYMLLANFKECENQEIVELLFRK